MEDEVRAWRDAGLDVVVSLLTAEEVDELGLQDEAARSRDQGLELYSFPIPDRGVPESRAAMEELVLAIGGALQSGRNVAVHCRQGIGRSSLLVASALVSAGESPDEAFRRIEVVRRIPVPETEAQRLWVERLASSSGVVRSRP